MGGINVGMLGAPLYGIARGVRDARADANQEENQGVETAIRRRQLTDMEGAAARRPQLEQQQDALTQLGIDTARLTLKQKEELEAQAKDARGKEEILKRGIGQFHASGNPQSIADALAEMHPREDGVRPTATRDDQGNITLSTTDGSGHPIVLKPMKINGVERSPDEQLAMFAYKAMNPVDALKQRYAADLKGEGEENRQTLMTDRAIERERAKGENALALERQRGDKERGRSLDRGKKLAKSYVDSGLKTTSVPGHFQATYSSEDDAKLLPHIYTRANELLDKDVDEAAAAQQAIGDTRTEFLTMKRKTLDAAAALQKAGIDPRDKAALAKARAAGNKDAEAYIGAIGAAAKRYGDDVGNYLVEQVPAKKK